MKLKRAFYQSFLSTFQQLGLHKRKRIILSLCAFGCAIVLVQYIGDRQQMEDEMNWGISVGIAAAIMFALLFLGNLAWFYLKRLRIVMLPIDNEQTQTVITAPPTSGYTPTGELRPNVRSYYLNERHRHGLHDSPDRPILALDVFLLATLPMRIDRLEMEIAEQMLPLATPITHTGYLDVHDFVSLTTAFDVPVSLSKGKQEVRLWAKAGGKNWPSESIVIDFDKLTIGKLVRLN